MDELDKKLPLLISFSGGRTSAFMTKFLIEHDKFKDVEKVICFANTGKEFEQTLDFVNECDKRWNLNVVWLEAKVNPEKGNPTTFTKVDYETASRNGEPFEAVIAKYGVPSKSFPHCTRELKMQPLKKYMLSLGYEKWHQALGIRADEPHRLKRNQNQSRINIIYPLGDLIQVNELFIRNWWDKQDFNLRIKDYEGNCDLCWKKSKRKRLTLIHENPNIVKWWNDMEVKYGKGKYLFDQREGLSIEELIKQASFPFRKVIDKYENYMSQNILFEPEMDMEWDCFCKAT